MYSEVFCKVYNEFGWNCYPEAFGESLMKWIRDNKIAVSSAMDLGCGTGVLCQILSRHGIEACGTDLSESMVNVAKQNYPHLSFSVADMVHYRPRQKYDLVTCTGDALNHIMDLGAVEQIFRNVSSYLSAGGYFILDILNAQEVSPCEPFDCPFSDTIRAEFQILVEDRTVNLKTRVFEDGLFRFEENIYETLHDPAVICALLQEAGLQVLQCADRLCPDEQPSTTWYIIAKKP